MPSSTAPSELEQAIAAVVERGWLIKGLGRFATKTSKTPWVCDVHPGHFREYVWGKPVKGASYTKYEKGMVRFVVEGATAAEAVCNAIEKIDASPEAKVYRRLDIALEKWAEAWRIRAEG